MSRIKVYNTSTGQWEYADKAYSGGGVSSWNDLKDKPDMITPPATASVGQTIVVKSVDENGKPTEWEAIDISSGTLIDTETGTSYKLAVTNGKLTLVSL